MTSSVSPRLSNGMEMPVLGLNTYEIMDYDKMRGAVEAAISSGYRLIDSALAYNNEAVLGQVLGDIFAGGAITREDITVVSKLPVAVRGNTSKLVRRRFNKTMKDLQLDYIDLYVIHCPVGREMDDDDQFLPNAKPIDGDIEGTWKEMEKLVDDGFVRALGLSNCNSKQITRIAHIHRHPICNLQVEGHLYLQQNDLRTFCRTRGIAITAFTTFGSPDMESHSQPGAIQQLAVIQMAQKHQTTPAQILLRHLVQLGFAVVPKSADPQSIREYSQIFDFSLDDVDMKVLASLDCGLRSVTLPWCNKDHPDYPFLEPY